MSGDWRDLVTRDIPDMPDQPCAPPKCSGLPKPLAKAEKKKTKAQAERDFRQGVWARDKSRSRASKKPLAKSGTDYSRVGEVHHVLKRSTHPEERLNVSNGILLSKEEHVLAETRCPNDPEHHLLDITGPEDLGETQHFVWRDSDGKVLKERWG